MVGSAAVLQTYQWLSPEYSYLLFPRREGFAYKPNLKGHGHEGPYPVNAPALHASTNIPCSALGSVPSPGQEQFTTGTEGLELHFGLLNASATHFDT